MRIAFATTQSVTGSTNVGRIMPLAEELTKKGADCFVIVQAARGAPRVADHEHTGVKVRLAGTLPFRKTAAGKERLQGMPLIFSMLTSALRTAWVLVSIKPGVVVISKPLPANVLGVWIYSLLTTNHKLVLDADDFELTANKLSSLAQRAVIHWSERQAAAVAQVIVVASPFLSDHFKQLTQNTKSVKIIPTGIAVAPAVGDPPSRHPQPLTLAYIGSVSVSSGHRVDLLPDILERIRSQHPLELTIAGDGDNVAQLQEEFRRRQLTPQVHWLGRFSSTQVHQLINSQTIIVDPVDDSIANRAKSSFRVMVAAAHGVPVVTSNIGIRPRLLPEQFHERFFADPGDVESYAQKIVTLAENPLTAAERKQLREHTATYTWTTLGASYYEILNAV